MVESISFADILRWGEMLISTSIETINGMFSIVIHLPSFEISLDPFKFNFVWLELSFAQVAFGGLIVGVLAYGVIKFILDIVL